MQTIDVRVCTVGFKRERHDIIINSMCISNTSLIPCVSNTYTTGPGSVYIPIRVRTYIVHASTDGPSIDGHAYGTVRLHACIHTYILHIVHTTYKLGYSTFLASTYMRMHIQAETQTDRQLQTYTTCRHTDGTPLYDSRTHRQYYKQCRTGTYKTLFYDLRSSTTHSHSSLHL